MSNRTGRVIYAGFRPGLDLDSHWFTHFVPVSGFFMFSFLFSFSKKLKFSVCIRFSLFNLIMWNDSLVIQWLSNVHLHCWFADSERQIFFYWRGKKSCSLCHWNFWIVASGSADNFNEEINMFIFYTVYLWMERRAVTLWRVVLCPLLGVCSILGRCPSAATQLGWALSCAVTPCVTLAHGCCWQCSSCSTPSCASPSLPSWGWDHVQDQVHGQLGFKSHPLVWANTSPTSAVGMAWGAPC